MVGLIDGSYVGGSEGLVGLEVGFLVVGLGVVGLRVGDMVGVHVTGDKVGANDELQPAYTETQFPS